MMNNLEIRKTIAKIEGVELLGPNKLNYKPPYSRCVVRYDPLTDDALCFRLIEKYDVTFNIYHDLDGIKYYYGDLWRDTERITIPDSKELKRFVCLYVIEKIHMSICN